MTATHHSAAPRPDGQHPDDRDGDDRIDELLVPFDDRQLRERARRRKRGMWSRVVSLGITAAILALLYFFGGEQRQGSGFLRVYAVILGISLAWLLGYLVAWLRARRALGRVGHGTAVRVGRPGIQVARTFTPWADVTGLAMVRHRGRGVAFEVRRASGPPAAVPLDQFDVHPATLDSTARAYSGGRHGVDLSALDV
ncbi:hypothetical protein SAMN04488543_3993 [Friedmanniella luteola]|uniref:PH domain-containing protein n=1 Tax=Friedmanniella luteola TaxID=546871 RepID=A0A1H1ZTP6_9ACTN|nr:hypothetical protein [Friedmanniella luteola]SDT36947.1 hypothetical protein SAMN04488543_3993 [Friedmanniella luteola]